MRQQAHVMVICLASIVGTSAVAHTLTKRDAQIVASLGKQAHGIEEDIHQYNVGRAFAPKNTEYVVQSACWRELFSVMEAVAMARNHDSISITLSAEMLNPRDEALSLMVVNADTEDQADTILRSLERRLPPLQ
jgi:hypothetical protein